MGPRTDPRGIPILLVVLSAAGCVGGLDLDDGGCPCVSGFVCDAARDRCVPEAEALPDAGEEETLGPTLCGEPGAPNLLVDPGFERIPRTFMPRWAGVWGGDPSELVAEEGGVSPEDGAYMLAFRATADRYQGAAAQVFQLLDPAPHALHPGDRLLTCASFNRVAGTQTSDRHFSIFVWGLAGDMLNFEADYSDPSHVLFGPLRADISADADPATWQRPCGDHTLAATQDDVEIDYAAVKYLAVEVRVREDVVDDPDLGAEFDGHFADDACFAIVPAP